MDLEVQKTVFKGGGEHEFFLALFKCNGDETAAEFDDFTGSEYFVLNGDAEGNGGGIHGGFELFLDGWRGDGGFYSESGGDKVGFGRVRRTMLS